jgi:hypothetical protein
VFGRLNIAYDLWEDEVSTLLEWWWNDGSDECMSVGYFSVTHIIPQAYGYRCSFFFSEYSKGIESKGTCVY